MPLDRDDAEYHYSLEHQRRLGQNLVAIYADLDLGRYLGQEYSIDLFCEWHRRLFEGVRDHAGVFRNPDFGPEVLVFGPNRSVHRDLVPSQLGDHSAQARRLIEEALDRAFELDIRYVREAVKIAGFIHADLIRIHPFLDGNGRVARLALDWVLLTLGFPCVAAFHIPAQEYRDALNEYYLTGDIDPLIDIVLRALSIGLS
jgi:fido (protein-threonine AMPylation protein)